MDGTSAQYCCSLASVGMVKPFVIGGVCSNRVFAQKQLSYGCSTKFERVSWSLFMVIPPQSTNKLFKTPTYICMRNVDELVVFEFNSTTNGVKDISKVSHRE